MYGGEKKMEEAIKGKALKSVSWDGTSLFLQAEGAPLFKIGVEGDCGSHSWIEHVSLPAMIGKEILGIRDVDMELRPGESDAEFECLAVYGFSVDTAGGPLLIDYRNESNGYYDGYTAISEVGAEPDDAKTLTEDF